MVLCTDAERDRHFGVSSMWCGFISEVEKPREQLSVEACRFGNPREANIGHRVRRVRASAQDSDSAAADDYVRPRAVDYARPT